MRLWGTLESQLAATLRDARARARRPGDHHLPAGRRTGDRHPVRARTRSPPTTGWSRCSPRTTRDTLVLAPGPPLDDLVAGALADRGLTVATAESCTGGLLAARLTDRPGSSAWVLGGVAAYANAAKEQLLDVPAELLAEHGAVSPEVAAALADGARARFGADVGVGITGVAGPGRRHAGEAGRHRAPVRRRPRRLAAARAAAARFPVRPCGTVPSRWRCTCCASCCVGGPPA